jgi:hypothetical protein
MRVEAGARGGPCDRAPCLDRSAAIGGGRIRYPARSASSVRPTDANRTQTYSTSRLIVIPAHVADGVTT